MEWLFLNKIDKTYTDFIHNDDIKSLHFILFEHHISDFNKTKNYDQLCFECEHSEYETIDMKLIKKVFKESDFEIIFIKK